MEKVFYLRADTLEKVRLEPTLDEGWARISVPRLEYWGAVVLSLGPE